LTFSPRKAIRTVAYKPQVVYTPYQVAVNHRCDLERSKKINWNIGAYILREEDHRHWAYRERCRVNRVALVAAKHVRPDTCRRAHIRDVITPTTLD